MKTVFIETKGCMHNRANSESTCSFLEQAGFEVFGISKESSTEKNLELADIIIFNTCTVKNPTEDAFFSRLKNVRETYPNKIIIVTGCIPQASPDDPRLKNVACLGIDQQHNIAQFIQKTQNNSCKHSLQRTTTYHRACTLTQETHPSIHILPILNGCLGNCAYCKTKHARGQLKSRQQEDILQEVDKALQKNKSELWLVSEDNGAWGKDFHTNQTFPQLIELIAQRCEQDQKEKQKQHPCMIRIGMCNPQYVKEYLPELITLFQKHACLFKFLHIPLQAGSNSVLKTMNRKYSVQDVLFCCEKLRKEFSDFSISTDIICGFPTESDFDWSQTIAALEQMKCNAINISKFYPRKGTPATKLQLITTDIVKSRSRELTSWFANQNYNKNYEGKVVPMLVSEIKNNSIQNTIQAIGRTTNYRQVIITIPKNTIIKVGMWVSCLITSTTRDDLRGKINF